MNGVFGDIDFNATVRTFEYTRRAVRSIHRVITSKDFEDMDVDMIFDFLLSEMELVSFKDYLKRYIYERAGMTEPFSSVGADVYREIIMDAFAQNQAPHAFTPTTVKWGTAVKRWLEQENVQRSTVLLLGFGLRMDDRDVSEFLTKVLKESDYDLNDPFEVVCRYCFAHDLRYSSAAALMDWYRAQDGSGAAADQPPSADCDEAQLKAWLSHLAASAGQTGGAARERFQALYRRAQAVVAALYQDEELVDNTDRDWKAEDVTCADVERMLSEGIPTTKSGNLQKMSQSLLSRQFQQRRMTRQRLELLLKGELPVERYDLIALQFLISSQNEDEDPTERCMQFMDDVNAELEACGMMKLYPANPYEAFVIMCTLTEMPLITYWDVWEKSYEN